jgi:hypothetical protein
MGSDFVLQSPSWPEAKPEGANAWHGRMDAALRKQASPGLRIALGPGGKTEHAFRICRKSEGWLKNLIEVRSQICYVDAMITHVNTSGNNKKVAKLYEVLNEVLEKALHRGFFGTATIELNINDGTIQHIRRKVEQVEN